MRCNIMNRIRKRLLFLFLVCIAMGTLNIGCSEDATPESDNKILKPIAENVIGKWNMDEAQKTLAEKLIGKWNFSKSYEKKNGEWVEISFGLPNEVGTCIVRTVHLPYTRATVRMKRRAI